MPALDQIVVPHVTPEGAVVPLAELAERVPAVLVDGSLAAGAIPVDVEALGVAAYAVDAHRWLLGPEGMAAMAIGTRGEAAASAVGRSSGAHSTAHP